MRTELVILALAAGCARGDVTLLGTASMPGTASDMSGLADKVENVPHNRLGSLGSGIAYSGAGDLYYCINDRGPMDGKTGYRCRYQLLRLPLGPPVTAELVGTTMLEAADGSPLFGWRADFSMVEVGGIKTPRRFDPEGIRFDVKAGVLYVCEEYGPRVCVFSLDGKLEKVWKTPAGFEIPRPAEKPEDERSGQKSGRFPNQGFEGLTITPGGLVYAVMQGALIQDSAGGETLGREDRDLRVVAFDPASGAEKAQYLYRLEASPARADKPYGVSEILAINDTDFLFLERDGSEKKMRRIYRASTKGATTMADVGIRGWTPMAKDATAFIDLLDPAFGLAKRMPAKIEGMTFGPDLADGRHTLVVSSDNDLEEAPTWFWVFAFSDADLPGLARP